MHCGPLSVTSSVAQTSTGGRQTSSREGAGEVRPTVLGAAGVAIHVRWERGGRCGRRVSGGGEQKGRARVGRVVGAAVGAAAGARREVARGGDGGGW